MRSLTLITALALAASCKAPDELGGNDTDTDTDASAIALTDALPALFTDFEQGCERLAVLVDAVEAGMVSKPIDLEGDKDQRVFSIAPLPHEGLDVTWPPDTNPEDQTPVVAFGRSVEDIDTNISVALEPNQVCLESNSTVYYERTYTEGTPEEMEAGTIDTLRSTAEIRKSLVIAKGWYDLFIDFHRCQTTDGRTFLAQRAWADQVWLGDNGANKFAQTFVAQLWIESPEANAGTTERVYAIWPQIDIGLGPEAMQALIGDSLLEGFENADAFAEAGDGPYDYCPNDRDAEKPPRD